MSEELKLQLGEVLAKFQSELTAIRTGRASSALVENLRVPDPYGPSSGSLTVRELASIAIPETRQILITPWDKGVLVALERALRESGFNPASEAGALRIVLPPLTGEERENLVKEVGVKAESARVALRGVRHEKVTDAERAKDAKEISEDELFTQKKIIDDLMAEFNQKIDQTSQEKKQQLSME